MKKLIHSTIVLMLSATVFAQAPQSFKYQAVARDASGEIIANQQVSFQISILQGSENGTAVYTETHVDSTNQFGLITLEIGTGTTTDDFTGIVWSNDTYFIQVEMDANGGTSYSLMGTSQLLSVPYALHATTADSLTGIINETDPVYSLSVAAGVTGTDTSNWNNKLDSYSEIDPIFIAWNKSYNDLINKPVLIDSINAIIDTTTQFVRTESDPIFDVSVASGITGTDTTNWNNKLDTEVDGSITNELQTISRTGKTITLSKNGGTYNDSVNTYSAGTGISISEFVINATNGSSSIAVYTTVEIAALLPSQGDAVYNISENIYQIYDGSRWVSLPTNCWPQPTNANAGSNQTLTDGSVTAILSANTPEANHGTGEWNIVSGTGGSFTDDTNPITDFTGTECTAYTLQWTISTSCNSSSDNVIIEFNQTPTTSNAGSDQSFTDGTTTATLAANTPETNHGTGEWSIISGTGGSFTDDTNPITDFTGNECTSYTLKWTISTSCDNSSDNVSITFNNTPTTADAGSDQTFTDGTTSTSLAANTPTTDHGTGLWTIESGIGGSLTDANSSTSSFTGVLHEVYTLRWTISTNCSNSTDDLVIAFHQNGPGSSLTDIDGNTYSTVWIGSQLWMAENLRTTHYANGDTIPDGTGAGDISGETDPEYWFAYGDDLNLISTYGRLYTQYTVIDSRNSCPTGWHVPTDAEWTTLENYLIANGYNYNGTTSGNFIAKSLAATTNWSSSSNSGAVGNTDYPTYRNKTGFTALPGGSRNIYGVFYELVLVGNWWSTNGKSLYLYYDDNHVNRSISLTGSALSVRCVRD